MHLFTVSRVPRRVPGSGSPKVDHTWPLPRGKTDRHAGHCYPQGACWWRGHRGCGGRAGAVTLELSPGTRVGGGQGKKAGKGDLGKGNRFSKAKAARKNMAYIACSPSSRTLEQNTGEDRR